VCCRSQRLLNVAALPQQRRELVTDARDLSRGNAGHGRAPSQFMDLSFKDEGGIHGHDGLP
jgi:hypothetical protein